jgi:hypothetical protein
MNFIHTPYRIILRKTPRSMGPNLDVRYSYIVIDIQYEIERTRDGHLAWRRGVEANEPGDGGGLMADVLVALSICTDPT